eukprot:Amastigsp_a341968_49.p2 type:complete len:143 gc:universal Amastigsp_a341968_49:1112-684(-)
MRAWIWPESMSRRTTASAAAGDSRASSRAISASETVMKVCVRRSTARCWRASLHCLTRPKSLSASKTAPLRPMTALRATGESDSNAWPKSTYSAQNALVCRVKEGIVNLGSATTRPCTSSDSSTNRLYASTAMRETASDGTT